MALPMAARAQHFAKGIPKIGVLWGGERRAREVDAYIKAFRDGLFALGYVEGQSILIEDRFAEQYAQFDQLAVELVQARVDVLVATSTPTAVAAKRATTMIPVVFAYATDPVGLKLVDSLAHPGGNVTGLSAMAFDLMPKQLELLNGALAKMQSLAVLYDPQVPNFQGMIEAYRQSAMRLKLKFHVFEAASPSELEPAFRAIAQARPDGLVIAPSLVFFKERQRIADLALANGLATMAWLREIAVAGVLMSYGANELDLYRRAATYIDKILKGSKAADLPVEQPTKFHLVFNARTANSLSLHLPDKMLALADEVIS